MPNSRCPIFNNPLPPNLSSRTSLVFRLLLLLIPFRTLPAADLPSALSRLPRTNLLVFHDRTGAVLPVKSEADWQQRRAEILRGMAAVMGPLPGRAKRCPLDLRLEEETDCGSYVRRSITYAA
jgi:hypothetical protein